METEPKHYWHDEYTAQTDIPSGVSAFLAWLLIWIRVCVGGGPRIVSPYDRWATPHTYAPNRQRRRMGQAKIPAARCFGANYILAGRQLTPRQFTEWQARYSLRGRINVYRFPYWRKTEKGKACPLGTEHEYWRDPSPHIGRRLARLSCCIWHAHLWPGWRRFFFVVSNFNARKPIWVGNFACLYIVFILPACISGMLRLLAWGLFSAQFTTKLSHHHPTSCPVKQEPARPLQNM